MKNYLLMILKARRAFQFVMLATISLLLYSCSTEGTETMEDPTVYDLLTNTNAKARAGNVAKGDDPIALIAINGNYSELVGALAYVDGELNAGLVDLFLNGKDQYTVFAPTNEAFYELYETLKVAGIEELPAELVLNVLLYHVTEGRRGSNSVVPPNRPRSIETLLGASFMVDKDANIIAIGNTANFENIDISASNGIIHVIDSVLLPIELD
ncbi:MAG: fasciclin domain-containing protein [Gillisia sp.]